MLSVTSRIKSTFPFKSATMASSPTNQLAEATASPHEGTSEVASTDDMAVQLPPKPSSEVSNAKVDKINGATNDDADVDQGFEVEVDHEVKKRKKKSKSRSKSKRGLVSLTSPLIMIC